jgi:hypothetical protein
MEGTAGCAAYGKECFRLSVAYNVARGLFFKLSFSRVVAFAVAVVVSHAA